ncbi:MAG: NUDIX domain-containing protein, partial [Victivallales bacterium]|nr:NUDIX domain-containing protein [Victivallales bacterium]
MTPLAVCAAVVFRGGKLLLATRRPGSSLAGKWEFPGGKVRPGESLENCIARELSEELGLAVRSATEMGEVTFAYPEKSVCLHFMLCTIDAQAEAVPREGQQCGWFAPGEWRSVELASADAQFLAEYMDTLVQKASESAAGESSGKIHGRLPDWLKTPFADGRARVEMQRLLRGGGLHT